MNAGHTFGHAFEIFYRLPHGQAVLMGLIWELKLAYYLGKVSDEFYQDKIDFLTSYINGFDPFRVLLSDVSEIINICTNDKKSDNNKIGFVFVLPYYDFINETLSVEKVEEFFRHEIR